MISSTNINMFKNSNAWTHRGFVTFALWNLFEFLFDFYNIRPRNQKAKFQKEKEFNHLLINLNIH